MRCYHNPKSHNSLCNTNECGIFSDKFDQFWSVNRKLMEHTGEELFKHIPFRIYQVGDNEDYIYNGQIDTYLQLTRYICTCSWSPVDKTG